MSSLKSSHRLVSFLAGLGIGALLLAALLLLTGCASTGQLAGAGCTYNLCGQLCCANDGKVCPLCYFDEAADTGCYYLSDGVGHLIIEGQEFEDDRGICEALRLR